MAHDGVVDVGALPRDGLIGRWRCALVAGWRCGRKLCLLGGRVDLIVGWAPARRGDVVLRALVLDGWLGDGSELGRLRGKLCQRILALVVELLDLFWAILQPDASSC